MTIPTKPGFYWMRRKNLAGDRWRVIEVSDDWWNDVDLRDCEWGERVRAPDEPEDLGGVEIPRWLQRWSVNPKDQRFVLTDTAHAALVDGLYFETAPDEVVKKQQTLAEWIECRARIGVALGFEAPVRDVNWTGFTGLLDEAKEIAEKWTYPDRVHLTVESPDNWLLVLSTGGWSENEAIMDECSMMFRALCWIAVRRGGHHIYGRGPLGDAAWEALMNTVLCKEEEKP